MLLPAVGDGQVEHIRNRNFAKEKFEGQLFWPLKQCQTIQ